MPDRSNREPSTDVPAEVDRRVAILTKLRENLLSQRNRFQRYLDVLEREEADIVEGDTERLEAHVELEKSVVSEIFAFQKAIDPLEDLYRAAYPHREAEIPVLKASLDGLKRKVLDRNKRNQELLRERMTHLRGKIMEVGAHRKLRSSFSSTPTPSLVDITT